MLDVQHMNVRYGAIEAVRDVSFNVPKGATIAMIGANGAGKSSIMKCLSGLIPLYSGSILFQGRPSSRRAAAIARGGISQVPEGRHVFPSLTVLENLKLGGFWQPRDRQRQRCDTMFELFPRLGERQQQLAGLLSGGEQQMLAMARALMADPALLLLDEPSMGLAPAIVDELYRVIARLKAAGTTILLVEQDVRRALRAADHVYVLELGRIKAQGSPGEIERTTDIASAYLGA